MRRRLVPALLASFAAAAASAGEPPPVKIAVCGPLTGDQGKMGEDIQHGVELAVLQWNAKGGVLGRKVEVALGDDQHDPKQARAVAVTLINQGVAGVVGHFNSSCTIPASDVYSEAGIPMITPASTNPQVTDRGYENVFRVCGRDDQQGRVAARYAVEVLKMKKVAVLHDKTTYGEGLANEFRRALGDSVKVVYQGGIMQEDLDYKAVLASVKAAEPELWFFGGIYPQAARLVKQARELGLAATFMSGDGTLDMEFIKIAGPAAEGAIVTFGPDPERIPTAKAFLEEYHKRYGKHGPYSLYAYDAANILLEGIRKAGSTEGAKVCAAIRAEGHEGAFGPIAFDAKGDVKTAPYICWKVVREAFVPIEDGPEERDERHPFEGEAAKASLRAIRFVFTNAVSGAPVIPDQVDLVVEGARLTVCDGADVQPGRKRLEVRKDGYRPLSVDVEIAPGKEPFALRFELVPE